ncbi:MAG TPA: DEAD/DEAH box helicase [Puia sp.]|nr:DEAD/DEAH box helicase [Puia sp.]
MSFKQLNLIEPLLKALEKEGYSVPTPIQEQAIPVILKRRDLLGCAQTGTGKTAAFALPLLQLMCEDAAHKAGHVATPSPIRALVLTPTRELAIQIDESFEAYGKFTRVRHTVIFGGVPQNPQVHALQKGVDVLVATPGRLLDLIDQGYINLQHIRYFVLDEADRMLDMGFIHDIRKVLARLPAKKHSLFFSATMPPEIQKLSGTILVNPEKVEVTPVSSTAETVRQSIYFVEKKDKRSLLLHVINESEIPSALVFTRTKHGADKVAQGLLRAGIRAEAIHGNKSQNARQRALANFKSRHTRILVATDIAARGIDIDELTHVINFELPNVPETYVHRIGRTGRAGATGTALSFCDQEEKEYLRDIQKLIARAIPVVENHPHAMTAGLHGRAPIVATTAPSHLSQEREDLRRSGKRRQETKRRDEARRHEERKRRETVKPQEVPWRRGEIKRAEHSGRREPIEHQEDPNRRDQMEPPDKPKRHEQAKHPEQSKHGVGVRLGQEQRRDPIERPATTKQAPDNPAFPYRVNQSEGDEKW